MLHQIMYLCMVLWRWYAVLAKLLVLVVVASRTSRTSRTTNTSSTSSTTSASSTSSIWQPEMSYKKVRGEGTKFNF
jgi:hypothetical protein